MKRYRLQQEESHNNYSCNWWVYIGYLLVNILHFSITIVIPVAGICCLEYPHIQAHRLEPFMVSYATDLTSTLFFFHDHPLDFTAANAVTAEGHNYTMSTLTPIICIQQHIYIIYITYTSCISIVYTRSYQSVLASLSSSPESSSSAPASDSAESLATGSNWYGSIISRPPSLITLTLRFQLKRLNKLG